MRPERSDTLLPTLLVILLPQRALGRFQASGLFLCPSKRAFAKAALVDESYKAFAGLMIRRLQAAFVIEQTTE
jgi:hypothetical protein